MKYEIIINETVIKGEIKLNYSCQGCHVEARHGEKMRRISTDDMSHDDDICFNRMVREVLNRR